MTEPIRRIPLARPSIRTTPRRLVDARVARHQRPRRLRVRHRRRRHHAPLSRPADRALPAPLGRIVMLSHLAEQLRLADGRRDRDRRPRTDRATRPTPTAPATSTEFRLEAGLPVWRYEVDGLIDREADLPAAHAEHRARDVRAASSGAEQRRARAAPVGELPPAGSAGERAARLAVRVSRGRATGTKSRCTGSALPPLRLRLCAPRRDVHAEGQAHRQHAVSGRGEPRLPGARRSVESRVLPADAARRRSRRRSSPPPNRSRR